MSANCNPIIPCEKVEVYEIIAGPVTPKADPEIPSVEWRENSDENDKISVLGIGEKCHIEIRIQGDFITEIAIRLCGFEGIQPFNTIREDICQKYLGATSGWHANKLGLESFEQDEKKRNIHICHCLDLFLGIHCEGNGN